jgi:hypothetical protein
MNKKSVGSKEAAEKLVKNIRQIRHYVTENQSSPILHWRFATWCRE